MKILDYHDFLKMKRNVRELDKKVLKTAEEIVETVKNFGDNACCFCFS